MSKIRVLPEILSNKIAAGEVVERPASVVKELLENALDAESRRIIVEVEHGGRSLIRVSDNGVGMGRDDALLAIERYATSKIFTDSDLFAIRTLGFRGEALPSIAAVCRFSLVTRERDADVGTAVEIEGGRVKNVSETGAPPGTMVTVRQLFYNTPARRKFLKTIATEMGHIADTIASMALGRPEIQFRLHHDGKLVKDWPAVPDPVERVIDVLGKALRHHLYGIEHRDGRIAISGWIGDARISRRTSRSIYVFVNGRWVRDPVIQHALFEGYAGRLMKGQFPMAVLSFRIPFDEVDVNVHPTKNQVRFKDGKRIHDLLRSVVYDTLKRSDRAVSSVSEAVRPYRTDDRTPREFSGEASAPPVFGTPQSDASRQKPPFQQPGTSDDSKFESATQTADKTQKPIWARRPFSDLKILGQLHGTYILCESVERLVMLDQHAAHERIRFEQLKALAAPSNRSAQKLIVAETLDLSFAEAETLQKLIPELSAFGLDIEPFGGNTFAVKAIPALLEGREIRPLVMEIIDTVADLGGDHGMEQVVERCLIVMACHGTIRARQVLTEQEMKTLLAQLDACENPSHCPHGRPVWIAWSYRELEKLFRRIV